MKKLLSGLAILMAVSAVHAASINWSISFGTKVINGYTDTPYTSTAYLILASDLSSITSSTQDKDAFTTALAALTLDASNTAGSDGKMTTVTGQVVTSEKLTAGVQTTFGLLIVSEDADGNGFYKVVEAKASPYATGADTSAQTAVKTSWTSLGTKDWNQGYAAPSPVTPPIPEPATGALALAGLALLFRRKRA